MDIKERLERLRERRDPENKEDWDKMVGQAIPNNNEELAALVEALGSATNDELAEVTEYIGGLEHYTPYESFLNDPYFSTGLESISDTVVRIFDRIIAFIKRWVKILTDADFKLSLMTGLHQATLDTLRTDMRASAGQGRSPKFMVNTRLDNLSINYRPIKDAQGLNSALTVLNRVVGLYFTTHDAGILSQVQQVVRGVSTNQPVERLADLMMLVSPSRLGNDSIMTLNSGRRMSPPLMGNHRFIIKEEDPHSSDLVDRIHGTRIEMERIQETNVQFAPIEFERFDVNMAEAILTKCSSILGVLADSNNGPRRHARRNGMQALLSCIEQVRAKADGIEEDQARRIVALLESYVCWIADPYTSIYSYVLRNVKAALNVVAANFE